ncbi:MAG: tRNA uridine-5-carboxymethylaminomethyl(34) synthesis GTPase MnmE [Clostridiales bacterium]|nr:tRNA uridine-5-carboxymethylaminomethyl(34) synthesis GTPase MnmE [Clostridiales bacterium]
MSELSNGLTDTIAAISTPHGVGGIGIIRISGSEAFKIAGELFYGKYKFPDIKSHTINHGWIINPYTGVKVDEVLVSKMGRPNSFTREDVVEINCHGGTVVLMDILSLVIKAGARAAEPGEFTKRAFLNGRLDLSQAEAVIDLINAKTSEGSQAAAGQLEGKLSKLLSGIRKRLIGLIAHIEVTVDYPEHDIEEITGKKVFEESSGIITELEAAAESFSRGRILREGIRVVIIGKPNVGKSSLLNELAGKSRAIVTEIPGTTRDIIEEYVSIKGIPVNIFDTAGIRETDDPIEKIGVERAKAALEGADLVIMVLDASRSMEAEDAAIIEKLSGRKVLYLLNKMDIAGQEGIDEIMKRLSGGKVMNVSALMGTGILELENEIAGMFMQGKISMNNEVLITNARHKNLVDKATDCLKEACSAYEAGMPLDCITIDIKNAAEYLGEITGESVSEDVVNEIFERFCIGK